MIDEKSKDRGGDIDTKDTDDIGFTKIVSKRKEKSMKKTKKKRSVQYPCKEPQL